MATHDHASDRKKSVRRCGACNVLVNGDENYCEARDRYYCLEHFPRKWGRIARSVEKDCLIGICPERYQTIFDHER